MNQIESLSLFRGIDAAEIRKVCDCFAAYRKTFVKGDVIFKQGSPHTHFGLIFDVSEGESEYIGELLEACETHSATITAQDKTEVLFVPFRKLSRQCNKACAAHGTVTDNFMRQITQTALEYGQRIDCLVQPTLRDKTMAYLLSQRRRRNAEYGECAAFETQHDRRGISEYLKVEYTALSRELSRLKREGVLDYDKNTYMIK